MILNRKVENESKKFYSGRLYEDLPKEDILAYSENPVSQEFLDNILCKSSESMQELSNNSVHLVVTSPPYNVGKEYDDDLTLNEYRDFLKKVWSEVRRVLVPGGRVCINVANLGRKPYIPLEAFIVEDMLDLGFLMRGEVIWNKSASSGSSTAWGSWLSAKNPVLRDVHEYILIFSKGRFNRESMGRKSSITKDEFLDFTKSVWTFATESAKRVGHPAPFPIELPYRLIQLYTFENEIILDPFVGSGQTAIAAIKSKRHYVGYEISKEYVDLSQRRINKMVSLM